MKVVVVGAGVAGLVCGRELQKNGVNVTLLESSDDVGGRVRSDVVEGHTIDRGFQVLFDAYPMAKRHLNLSALQLQAFDPGAVLCQNGRQHILTDPMRDGDLADVASAMVSTSIPLPDKLRTLRLLQELTTDNSADDSRDIAEREDSQSTEQFLVSRGFSRRTIDTFFRPFYGGIFLDRQLRTSACAFKFYFRMMAEGKTAIPALGMSAISKQLAEPLALSQSIKFGETVDQLIRDGDRTIGVRTTDGEEYFADSIVLAVDAHAASKLSSVSAPESAVGCTTVYLAGDRAVTERRKLFLNSNDDAFVNNLQPLSVVAPAYSPPNRHLLGATIIGVPDLNDTQIYAKAMLDIQTMLQSDKEATRALASYSPLCVRRIQYAQFTQREGTLASLPGNVGPDCGLFFAAEWTQSCSINGAMLSGEKCAHAILASTPLVSNRE